MITTGESPDRIADLLEDLLEKLDELVDARQEVLVNVPPGAPPVVNVEAPVRPSAWKFKVYRDDRGLIDTITATPKI